MRHRLHARAPGQARPGDEFDTDNEEHMVWVYERAAERAAQYGIQVGG